MHYTLYRRILPSLEASSLSVSYCQQSQHAPCKCHRYSPENEPEKRTDKSPVKTFQHSELHSSTSIHDWVVHISCQITYLSLSSTIPNSKTSYIIDNLFLVFCANYCSDIAPSTNNTVHDIMTFIQLIFGLSHAVNSGSFLHYVFPTEMYKLVYGQMRWNNRIRTRKKLHHDYCQHFYI